MTAQHSGEAILHCLSSTVSTIGKTVETLPPLFIERDIGVPICSGGGELGEGPANGRETVCLATA